MKFEHLVLVSRYESNMFYDQSTQIGNLGVCGNQTASEQSVFETTVESLLGELVQATPRINSFFAASNKEVVGANGNVTVYGVAQCVETIDKKGCEACLQVAEANIRRCPPESDGRAVDTGCFLRYSELPFFAANHTIDLTPFLKSSKRLLKINKSILFFQVLEYFFYIFFGGLVEFNYGIVGDTSKRTALIGGLVGGGGFLLLLCLLLFWVKISRKKKAVPQGMCIYI